MGYTIDQELEMLRELEKYDTPSITNVLATYPADKDLCMGLYHPWEGYWYSDQALKCMYPELGPKAGFAVTCVYGLPDASFNRLSINDVFRAIDKSPKPAIVVIKQDIPENIKNISGLSGGNMTTAFAALGAIGAISDGPSRDIDEIRSMGFQYMLTGMSAGHGPYSIRSVGEPVEICGMRVANNDIIHMDINGAVKFPREYLPKVLELVLELADFEEKKLAKLSSAQNLDEVISAFGMKYGDA